MTKEQFYLSEFEFLPTRMRTNLQHPFFCASVHIMFSMRLPENGWRDVSYPAGHLAVAFRI